MLMHQNVLDSIWKQGRKMSLFVPRISICIPPSCDSPPDWHVTGASCQSKTRLQSHDCSRQPCLCLMSHMDRWLNCVQWKQHKNLNIYLTATRPNILRIINIHAPLSATNIWREGHMRGWHRDTLEKDHQSIMGLRNGKKNNTKSYLQAT